MSTITHDVVVVGGGGAGLRAAIAVAEKNPALSVALVSKVYPMRSHTVSAEGGSAAVIKDNDSLEDHFNDTVVGSDWLADQDAVDIFINEAPRELIQMEHWGCPWSRDPDGTVSVRPFGGMKIERTWYAADKTGFHMLHTLFQTSIKYPSIKRYDEYFASSLITADGRCQGVIAYEQRYGKMIAIRAKAVIMATGGAGRIFPFTTNGGIKTGDGMAMAWRAGVPMKDMEFIQYHPTGLVATGILITEASRGEGGILLNKDGRRYLQDYGMGPPDPWPRKKAMELGPRDRLSQAWYWEREKGNTIKTQWGESVHLDIRHLGEAKIMERLPFVRELSINYAGVDPVHEPIPVRPVIHYMMGGIDTDNDGATPVPGMYAAGEVACVSINGSNRLGSNSLTELLVFGRRAGEHAVNYIADAPDIDEAACDAALEAERQRIREIMVRTGDQSVAKIRIEMQHTMEDGCGIYRTADSLEASRKKLIELRERWNQIELEDKSNSYNTQLQAVLELDYMLDMAQAIVASASARTESRGAHQRLDHEARDDAKFLKHTMAHRTDDAPRIDYKDVVITKSQPAERVYGSGK